MNSLLVSDNHILYFALILLRVISFIFSSAIFSSANINIPVKVLFSIVLSFTVFTVFHGKVQTLQPVVDQIILLSAQEVFRGLCLGLITRFFFFAVSMSGDLISISIGLSSAQIYNPVSGTQSNIFEQFQVLLATLIFFALQGHHMMIGALTQSFEIFPVTVIGFNEKAFGSIVGLGAVLMEIAIKMAAPVMVAILLVNLMMGILGRTVPQLNVLMTGFSFTLLAGFLVLVVTLPLMVTEMNSVADVTGQYLFQFMRAF